MKRIIKLCLSLLACVALLAGCSLSGFTFTTVGNKVTISTKEAKDGATAETDYLSVGKGRVAVVTSSLEQGELKIDFRSVTVFQNDDDTENVMPGDIFTSVTVGSGDEKKVAVDSGDYILEVTAIGQVSGKVQVNFEKQ